MYKWPIFTTKYPRINFWVWDVSNININICQIFPHYCTIVILFLIGNQLSVCKYNTKINWHHWTLCQSWTSITTQSVKLTHRVSKLNLSVSKLNLCVKIDPQSVIVEPQCIKVEPLCVKLTIRVSKLNLRVYFGFVVYLSNLWVHFTMLQIFGSKLSLETTNLRYFKL